ncbi:unnamed protein product, partial [marine sediment metagenome]
ETGVFNEKLLKYGDREFYLRFLTLFDIDIIPEVLANYHARPYDSGLSANSTLNNSNYKNNSYWENKVMNSLLRSDFKENKTGLGFIANFVSTLSPMLENDKAKNSLANLKGKKILLYGAGIKAEEFFSRFENELAELNICGIIDQDKSKQGLTFHGHKIYSAESIKKLAPEVVLLTVANKTMVKPFVEKLIKTENLNCKISEI